MSWSNVSTHNLLPALSYSFGKLLFTRSRTRVPVIAPLTAVLAFLG
jgi:hypothetical protein